MENPILYVILNKELKMSAGKGAAQAVHAAMSLENNYNGHFASRNKRTVIVLEAENAEQLKNLKEYLLGAGIFSTYYIDEGVNEVGAYSLTALAVEPFDSKDEKKRELFSSFRLFDGNEEDEEDERDIVQRHLMMYIRYDNAPWYVKKALKWIKKQ